MGALNPTLHAFLALLAGFAAILLLQLSFTSLQQKIDAGSISSQASTRPASVALRLGWSFLAATAGGYVTAWIAASDALRFILPLAIGVLILGAVSALQSRGRQPTWYAIAEIVISPLGVLIGGFARLRVLGIL